MHMETSKDQKPANSVDKGPPNYQASSEHYEKRDVSVNSYGPSSRSAPNSQNFPSTDVGANEAMPVGTSHPDMRPFGMLFKHCDCFAYRLHVSKLVLCLLVRLLILRYMVCCI